MKQRYKKFAEKLLNDTKWGRKTINGVDKRDADFLFSLPTRQHNFYAKFYTENAYKEIEKINKKTKPKNKKFNKISEKNQKTIDTCNLQECLYLLNKTFTINKNVKKKAYTHIYIGSCYDWEDDYYTKVDYNLRNTEYSKKTANIIKVINSIKLNRLPIKYGKNDGVIYFEYCGNQVSFHDPKNIIHCKPFNGEWTGIINKTIPFKFA